MLTLISTYYKLLVLIMQTLLPKTLNLPLGLVVRDAFDESKYYPVGWIKILNHYEKERNSLAENSNPSRRAMHTRY